MFPLSKHRIAGSTNYQQLIAIRKTYPESKFDGVKKRKEKNEDSTLFLKGL